MRKLLGHPGRGGLAAALLIALASGALPAAGGASAQSGRKRSGQPTQKPAQAEPRGESESGPKTSEAKPAAAVAFAVMEQEDSAFGIDSVTRGDVLESFATRLGRSPSVMVSRAGRGSRGDANKRAKAEEHSHVVLVALEEDYLGDPGRRRTRQSEQRSLVIRTSVFAPKTGSLKFSDTVFQRAARPSVGVGGVRLPIPTRTGRYPSQLELRQAAQDAADRLLSRFQIAPPADIP